MRAASIADNSPFSCSRFAAALINDANGDQSPDVLVSVVFDCRLLNDGKSVFSFLKLIRGTDLQFLEESLQLDMNRKSLLIE